MPRRERHLFKIILLLVAVSGVAVLSGCKSNPVGRQCFIESQGGDAGIPVTVVSSPALECQSYTCIHVPGHSPDLCTAECSSDSDCDTSAESPCQTGFACITPTVVGNFCCQKLCVCKDYLPGGIPGEPIACDSANAANECCNLAGRRDNPTQYPGCR